MCSDIHMGALLKTLVASKPAGNFLELGTGMGLSFSWMVDGMDIESTLISIDNNPRLIELAQSHFVEDEKVMLICTDAASWLESYKGKRFDLVFADAWPGKYSHFEEVHRILAPGGFYIIDDMSKRPNWPSGHEENALELVKYLEARNDMEITKMDWSTGIIIAVKK